MSHPTPASESPRLTPPSKAGPLLLLLSLVPGGFAALTLAPILTLAVLSQSWVEHPAVLEHARVKAVSDSEMGYDYFVDCQYHYTVDEETYTSQLYGFTWEGYGERNSRIRVEELLQQQREGRFTVRVSPRNPRWAAVDLEPDYFSGLVGLGALLLSLLLFGRGALLVVRHHILKSPDGREASAGAQTP